MGVSCYNTELKAVAKTSNGVVTLATISVLLLLLLYVPGLQADSCLGGITAAAQKLASCIPASKNAILAVPTSCCLAIQQMFEEPAECLCAVVTSSLAQEMGVIPNVALTIPKRCKIASRPIGFKCDGTSLP